MNINEKLFRVVSTYYSHSSFGNKIINLPALAEEMKGYEIGYFPSITSINESQDIIKIYIKEISPGLTAGISKYGKIWLYDSHGYSKKKLEKKVFELKKILKKHTCKNPQSI